MRFPVFFIRTPILPKHQLAVASTQLLTSVEQVPVNTLRSPNLEDWARDNSSLFETSRRSGDAQSTPNSSHSLPHGANHPEPKGLPTHSIATNTSRCYWDGSTSASAGHDERFV